MLLLLYWKNSLSVPFQRFYKEIRTRDQFVTRVSSSSHPNNNIYGRNPLEVKNANRQNITRFAFQQVVAVSFSFNLWHMVIVFNCCQNSSCASSSSPTADVGVLLCVHNFFFFFFFFFLLRCAFGGRLLQQHVALRSWASTLLSVSLCVNMSEQNDYYWRVNSTWLNQRDASSFSYMFQSDNVDYIFTVYMKN